MSQMRTNAILDASGGNTAQINGALAVNTTNLRTELGASGAAPIYACRAWVCFNGVTGAIRASGNVSSVVKNGTGDYTINFANALQDGNYAISGHATLSGSAPNMFFSGLNSDTRTGSACRVRTGSTSPAASAQDGEFVSVAIFR